MPGMKIPLHWHTEPLLLLLVIGASWAHALACGPYRARCLPGRTEYPTWHAVRFHLGVLVAYVAVGSPLDQLGEGFLFWAHMLQHMLLIYVAAPLIVTGLPPELIDGWLLGGRPRLARLFRVLTHPIAGGLIFTLCFSIWHFPELYEAALRSRPLHVLEHWSMFLPALLMVWPLFSLSATLPRIGYGQAMFYSFALMVADLPLWAVLIFGEHPIYETYRLAPRISGLSASSDMILGAVVMKGFNEVFALGCMAYAFFAWYQREK
ncbi:MAG: cytochrome c oxidase assembly protein [Verrucomicrobia bacterium]|jgi:putative membrane protein|nr:cytochrome c oxidase assembly protein [Verrucomicrobiota bacterium]